MQACIQSVFKMCKQWSCGLSDYFDICSRGESNDITTVCKSQTKNQHMQHACISEISIATVRCGFAAAVLGTLMLLPDGLLSLGPPCGSFVFLNRSTSGRSKERPYGHEHRSSVEQASLTPDCICAESCMHACMNHERVNNNVHESCKDCFEIYDASGDSHCSRGICGT